jgi:N-acetylglutamate synthase-like GNAT family acetyltransferase
VVAFLILRAPAQTFALSLHKAGKHMMNDARRRGIKRVVATAEANNPAAEPWLARFGFEPVTIGAETVWVWSNE